MSSTKDSNVASKANVVIHTMFGILIGIRFLLHCRDRQIEVNSWSSAPEHSPLPPNFYATQQLMLAGAILLVVSVLTSTMLSVGRGSLILSGLSDLALAAILITATARQLSSIPASESGCYPYAGPQSLQEMFVGLAKDQNKTPGKTCNEFRDSWICAVMSLAGIVPTALIGIFAPGEVGVAILTFHLWITPVSLGALGYGAWLALRHLWEFYLERFLYLVTTPVRVALFVLARIPAVSRYRDRRAEQMQRNQDSDLENLLRAIKLDDIRSAWSSHVDSDPAAWESKRTLQLHVQRMPHTGSAFEDTFTRDAPLLALLRHCHFEDAWQLGQTSKSLRSATRKAALTNFTQRSSLPFATTLRIMTCWRGSKSSCWGCGIQICSGCTTAVGIPKNKAPRTTAHLILCEARCVRCYVDKMCGSKSARSRTNPCKHILPASVTTASFNTATASAENNRDDDTESQAPRRTHGVCSRCSNLTLPLLLEKRELIETGELRWLARSTVACGSCKRLLEENGPRFWACCECGAECTSDFHPSWRGKIDEAWMAHLEPLSALFNA